MKNYEKKKMLFCFDCKLHKNNILKKLIAFEIMSFV